MMGNGIGSSIGRGAVYGTGRQLRMCMFSFHIGYTLSILLNLLQEVKSYPVQWIKVVEKIDENAFHRKHMFQVVVVPSGHIYSPDTPSQVTLYLQAAVSERKNFYR